MLDEAVVLAGFWRPCHHWRVRRHRLRGGVLVDWPLAGFGCGGAVDVAVRGVVRPPNGHHRRLPLALFVVDALVVLPGVRPPPGVRGPLALVVFLRPPNGHHPRPPPAEVRPVPGPPGVRPVPGVRPPAPPPSQFIGFKRPPGRPPAAGCREVPGVRPAAGGLMPAPAPGVRVPPEVAGRFPPGPPPPNQFIGFSFPPGRAERPAGKPGRFGPAVVFPAPGARPAPGVRPPPTGLRPPGVRPAPGRPPGPAPLGLRPPRLRNRSINPPSPGRRPAPAPGPRPPPAPGPRPPRLGRRPAAPAPRPPAPRATRTASAPAPASRAAPIAISAIIGFPEYIPTPATPPPVGSAHQSRRCFGTPLDLSADVFVAPGFLSLLSPGSTGLPSAAGLEPPVGGFRTAAGAAGAASASASGSTGEPLSSAISSLLGGF